jgi:NADPH:quinone reductase-like Zn-dependent oxidoreductase
LIIQLARHMGARVTTTCRTSNIDYIQELGADAAISYECDEFDLLRDQDVVFDLVGGDVHRRSYTVLRPGGHLAYLTAAPIIAPTGTKDVRVSRAFVQDTPEALQAVADFAAEGVLNLQCRASSHSPKRLRRIV